MIKNKTIAVVVPCYNEETQVLEVIDTMPSFVDRIIIVNDASKDKTLEILKTHLENYQAESLLPEKKIKSAGNARYNKADLMADEMQATEDTKHVPSEEIKKSKHCKLVIINHLKNGGVGGAISSGYKWCRDNHIDCTAVMAGDGQMDPDELESICMPVINGEVDYVKGNRLIHRAARMIMPRKRFIGNSILSILTKIASGYWHISDTQTGYTAINADALQSISLPSIYKSYGMPNDLLVKLNIGSFTIKEVPIKPIYNVGEQSKMKIRKVIPKVSWLLMKCFVKRIFIKYFINDFHPLSICYAMVGVCTLFNIWVFNRFFRFYFIADIFNDNYFLLASLSTMLTTFFLLFGMWFDMQDNERLQK